MLAFVSVTDSFIMNSKFGFNLVDYPSRFGYPDGAVMYADKLVNNLNYINCTFYNNIAATG